MKILMKFIRLLREVLKLSLSKCSVLLLLLMIFLAGCQKKVAEQAPVTVKPFYNYDSLLSGVKSLLHADEGVVLLGNFKGDTTQQPGSPGRPVRRRPALPCGPRPRQAASSPRRIRLRPTPLTHEPSEIGRAHV